MSSESSRLTRKLRRAMNQQSRAARLAAQLVTARITIQILRRRNKMLRQAIAQREAGLTIR